MDEELRKILFVDDDEVIHSIVKACFKEIPNVEMRSAFSGEEAIKIALDFQPDLILLDVMMPQMDGVATLQILKLLPSFFNTPVVFLTAKTEEREIVDYFKYGVVDVIAKPFNQTTFANNIHHIWKKYQKRTS